MFAALGWGTVGVIDTGCAHRDLTVGGVCGDGHFGLLELRPAAAGRLGLLGNHCAGVPAGQAARFIAGLGGLEMAVCAQHILAAVVVDVAV